MAVNIPALISVIVFYIVILVVGILAGRKSARATSSQEIFLANRNIGLFIAFFTLTATMVGGGFINGTAEMMARSGLAMTSAPFGYAMSLFIGGLFYAPKMRRCNYVTMFDPFQIKYGRRIGGLLFFPQICGDLFWTAAILAALGTTVAIILGISNTVAIILSACVAVFYTFLGGLLSVAYTDVIQLGCILVGLFLAFPFALNHPSVDMSRVSATWPGQIDIGSLGSYIDQLIMVILGGIPWQVYYQRVLACKTPEKARFASIMAAGFCLVLAIPPAMIGLIGAAADWNQTSYDGPIPLTDSAYNVILPMVLNYLCPLPVAVIGIGAVAAAVMSSADSCVLSTGTVFAKNIYRDIFRRKASDREQIWVLRITIVVVGIVGAALAITAKTIYGLFILCSDLMYVILFPQLTCVLWYAPSNTYGCLMGYVVGLVCRILSGEPIIALPAVIKFPLYDESLGIQQFPIRTTAMLLSLLTIIGVSLFANFLFTREILSLEYDVFKCIKKENARRRQLHHRESIFVVRPGDLRVSRKQSKTEHEKEEAEDNLSMHS